MQCHSKNFSHLYIFIIQVYMYTRRDKYYCFTLMLPEREENFFEKVSALKLNDHEL